jgi:hypothetical protein
MCKYKDSENIQERLIGIGELAELLSCKPQTIRNKLSLGIFAILTYKLLGRLKWKLSEVENYLNRLRRIN